MNLHGIYTWCIFHAEINLSVTRFGKSDGYMSAYNVMSRQEKNILFLMDNLDL